MLVSPTYSPVYSCFQLGVDFKILNMLFETGAQRAAWITPGRVRLPSPPSMASNILLYTSGPRSMNVTSGVADFLARLPVAWRATPA